MIYIFQNWRSSLAIIPFGMIAWLLHEKTLTTREALTLLAATGSYLAAVAKDGK